MSVASPSNRHRRKKQFCVAAIVMIAATVVAGFAVRIQKARIAHASGISGDAYAQAVEEARRSGIPITPQALQTPLPPATQNAAQIYTQLTELLAKHPLSKEDEIAKASQSSAMPSAAQFERISRALNHRADLMALIHKAVRRPECVFVRNWADPVAIRYKELATIRTTSRLLVAESLLLAHDGRPLDAVRNQALGFNLARHVENEDTVLEYLVAVTVDAMPLQGLHNILYVSGSSPVVADAVNLR